MWYLTDAFSINMLPLREYRVYKFIPISSSEAAALLHVHHDRVVNAIGHADLVAVVENILRAEVDELELPPPQRVTVQLSPEDEVVVAQYTGTRLPEGATQLPGGAQLEFWVVTPFEGVVIPWLRAGCECSSEEEK